MGLLTVCLLTVCLGCGYLFRCLRSTLCAFRSRSFYFAISAVRFCSVNVCVVCDVGFMFVRVDTSGDVTVFLPLSLDTYASNTHTQLMFAQPRIVTYCTYTHTAQHRRKLWLLLIGALVAVLGVFEVLLFLKLDNVYCTFFLRFCVVFRLCVAASVVGCEA